MSDTLGPGVQRRRLRTELRRARQGAGLTQEQTAKALEWSLSKVIRIENGAVGVSTTDLKALLALYHVTTPERVEELVAVARATREPSWWSKYRELIPPKVLQFLEYETAASVIRSFEPLPIPGLLQTESYAKVIIADIMDDLPANAIDTLVEIRMKRQQILERPDPLVALYVIDEAAIRRLEGDITIMREQVAKLISMATRPNISVEIVPFSASMHVGMTESFTIFEFPDAADSDELFIEGSRDTISSHDEAHDILPYREKFEWLRSISLGSEGSLSYLRRISE